jgi:LacI family transcriptional regulator
VLNGKATEKRISEDLQKQIIRYAKKNGYQPNMLAKSLSTGKSKILGMMVEYISDPFFASIARLIEEKASALGYKLLYSSTENDTQKTKDLIRVYRESQVEGYIIAPPPGIEKEIKALAAGHTPLVLFDRFFPTVSTFNVVVDNCGGCYDATRYFISEGYKHIALVTLDVDQMQMSDRLKGYTQAVTEGERASVIYKVPFVISPEERKKTIVSFLKNNPGVDAVLFATNYLAISGIQAINELQIPIPGEIGVISFDDNTHFDLFTPSITSIAQPVSDISDAIMQLLWMQLNGDSTVRKRKETKVLATKLMIRKSVTGTGAEQ